MSQGAAYASKAAYTLLGQAQATPDALQAPHCQLVSQQLQAPGTYLLVKDTTELSWPEAAERGLRCSQATPPQKVHLTTRFEIARLRLNSSRVS